MKSRPALHPDRINVDEDYDLRAWADKFGVDKERVQKAVRAVGADATAVERYLDRRLGGRFGRQLNLGWIRGWWWLR
jgi:hypothetical protein